MSTAIGSRFVVRPTPMLLLRRVLSSSDGKLLVFVMVLAPIAASQFVHPVAGFALGILLAVGTVAALARTRLEVTAGKVVVANLFRTYRLDVANIADVAIQSVNYTNYGTTLNRTHRLVVVTTEKSAKGEWVSRPAFATERKSSDKVEAMAQALVRTLRGDNTGPGAVVPPPSAAASSG